MQDIVTFPIAATALDLLGPGSRGATIIKIASRQTPIHPAELRGGSGRRETRGVVNVMERERTYTREDKSECLSIRSSCQAPRSRQLHSYSRPSGRRRRERPKATSAAPQTTTRQQLQQCSTNHDGVGGECPLESNRMPPRLKPQATSSHNHSGASKTWFGSIRTVRLDNRSSATVSLASDQRQLADAT